MSVKTEFENDTLYCRLEGEIDHHSALSMRLAIDEQIENSRPKETVLDFSGVTFMDSSGIGLVMGRYKLCNECGGTLTVCGLSDSSYKVMKLAGLGGIAVIKKGGLKNDRK